MTKASKQQDRKRTRLDIERFEDSMFRVLATMDRTLLHELISNYGLEACDRDGRNILINLIIEHGEDLCMHLLHEYEIDVNATDSCSLTALYFATIEDSPEIIVRLLDLGAMVDAQDEDGNTPLFYASRYRVSPTVISLLRDHGASLMIPNKHGIRPIDLPIQS